MNKPLTTLLNAMPMPVAIGGLLFFGVVLIAQIIFKTDNPPPFDENDTQGEL